MSTVAEQMLSELEESVKDLVDNFGNHEGDCTNAAQMKNVAKVAPCTKHQELLAKRKARVESALMQLTLLRNMFTAGLSNEQREF